MSSFLFAGAGGLGDVARRFYLTNTYELLAELTEPTFILAVCHNPAALDFFRFHPNHGRLVVCDVGHIYMDLMRDRVTNAETNRRLIAMCGLLPTDDLTKTRDPKPIGKFHAPDTIASQGHVVIHPFARGWGNWPEAVCDVVRAALKAIPPEVQVFVLSADYVSTDGRVKRESFAFDQPNVTVLKNLSAPAAFTLVSTASRFMGTVSALAQVAAFERVPSLVLHPARCTDFIPPYNGYSKSIWNGNGLPLAYDALSSSALEDALVQFLRAPNTAMNVREAFASLGTVPAF